MCMDALYSEMFTHATAVYKNMLTLIGLLMIVACVASHAHVNWLFNAMALTFLIGPVVTCTGQVYNCY